MSQDNLKDLSPQERLKVLKEIEQQKKKEIKEARELIKESEKEITAQHEYKEKVPIPEANQINLEGLSEEGRQLLMVLKNLKETKKQKSQNLEESNDSTQKKQKTTTNSQNSQESQNSNDSLEDTIAHITPIPIQVQNTQYAMHLSEKPMKDLYREMAGIYETSQERGYMTSEDQKRVAYLSAGVQHKMEAIDNGSYNASDDLTSRVKSIKILSSHMLGRNPDQMYQSGTTKETQRDRYTGREV